MNPTIERRYEFKINGNSAKASAGQNISACKFAKGKPDGPQRGLTGARRIVIKLGTAVLMKRRAELR